MNMKKRVLVVGANGFIGTHLVNELIANKIPVTVLLKNKRGHKWVTLNLDQLTMISIIPRS